MRKTIPFLFFSAMFILMSSAVHADETQIIDSSHYSQVFGEIRNFRVFLPPDYYRSPGKRYPVIYFFHGHSQRYFGTTGRDPYERGEDNGGDNIANFVAKNDVIVVKWDGFNLRDGDEYYLRPYNIGPVETHRQFPLYFPELVGNIDKNFRTIPDRGKRAVSGLSMGGFMTFWIAGKYPDMLCAGGNFCGSPEFVVGPKDFPVEYRHIDMYRNYGGVNLRLNYGDEDFIRAYHEDMNKIFPRILPGYEFSIYHAAHSTCGLGEMFDFIMDTFDNPPEKPERWNHIDVYPEFSVWGWEMATDRDRPGFTILENTDKHGFRSSVREFVPNGGLMPWIRVAVTTAPLYGKNTDYRISDTNNTTGEHRSYVIRSGSEGKLRFDLDGYEHDIGINSPGDGANLTIASWTIENMGWIEQSRDMELSVRVLNKGIGQASDVSAEIRTAHDDVSIIRGKAEIGSLPPGETGKTQAPFKFKVTGQDAEVVQFEVLLTTKNGDTWAEKIELPVRNTNAVFENIVIADGREFTVADSGDKTADMLLGVGNGDGIANPGETIVILVHDKEKNLYRRNLLYSANPIINPNGIVLRGRNYWGTYDHVGGSEKYSLPVIASGCPDGERIEFFAEHWIPDYPYHPVQRAKIALEVSGHDTTPPVVQWVKTGGDNIIQSRIYDGSAIKAAKVKLSFHKPSFNSLTQNDLELTLNDDGVEGDRVKGDGVFSGTVPELRFGMFTAEIEAADSFGNTIVKSFENILVLH